VSDVDGRGGQPEGQRGLPLLLSGVDCRRVGAVADAVLMIGVELGAPRVRRRGRGAAGAAL
jgi:hypothetical protein